MVIATIKEKQRGAISVNVLPGGRKEKKFPYPGSSRQTNH